MRIIRSLILLLGLSMLIASAPPRSEIIIPAEDGKIAVRDLLSGMFEAVGAPAPAGVDEFDWTINLSTVIGRLQLAVFDRLADGAIETERRSDALVISFDERAIQEHGAEIGGRINEWVAELMGREGEVRRFGMTLVTNDAPRASTQRLPRDVRRAVVLIHGLDDPGWMWNDLAPRLIAAEHVVLRFEYPNDQAIAPSADFFAAELARLKRRGIDEIDIVAHSMGGLVTREVLTREGLYAGEGTGGDRFPAIDRLIMLGTPNGGSELARLRGVAEMREQIVRWFIDDEHDWDNATTDGNGEAGADLLPGSPFLSALNARPAPSHTVMTIVAGRVSPVDENEIDSFMGSIRSAIASENSPAWLQDLVNEAAGSVTSGVLQAAVRGLGDGVVTLKSARLDGVEDFVEVEANHISMIANLTNSERVPPAIPIVLERLAHKPTQDAR